MSKHGTGVPQDRLELYERLVETNREVVIKGAKSAYTSKNGHMFSFMTEEGSLALRLPNDERDAFIAAYKTEPVIQYGAVMKEYVEVPIALLHDTHKLMQYFEISFSYVCSLKPKPTKRKKRT